MSRRSKLWIALLVGAVVVLALLGGALPLSWYSFEHQATTDSEPAPGFVRKPIVSSVWLSGKAISAAQGVDLQPDLLVCVQRLDWEGAWWTPVWKSGTLRYALDAEVLGGRARGGLDLHDEGEFHATFRGLCSPARAREDLEDVLRKHVLAKARELAGT